MPAPRRLLILDDEVSLVDALVRHLDHRGYVATSTYLVAEATAAIEQSLREGRPFDAILADLQLPDGDGRTIVRLAREKLPKCPVVMMTGSGSVSGTVEAIRLGAITVLEKPVALDVVENELRGAIEDLAEIPGGLDAASEAGIVGRSPAIRAVLDALLLAAPTDAIVLIQGETGTGKELVARAIHRLSRRARTAFIAVNCAALPETLVESELFGHAKGAFTGAEARREGRFQQAHRGTLFLDEVGELPLPLQAKLLRVLQEGEVQPLGSAKTDSVDVRVVAATNRNLEQLVAEGRFRADLYYRLNVVPLQIPPLRERRADIALLAAHFLRTSGRRMSAEAMALLEAHPWPGNVREMQNLIQRLLVLKPKGDLEVSDLPPPFHERRSPVTGVAKEAIPPQGLDLHAVLAELEDRLIREALERSGGNKNQAALSLGIKRTTLVEKLRRMSRR